MSSAHCKGSQATKLGVWVRTPPWVMFYWCWMNAMGSWWYLMPSVKSYSLKQVLGENVEVFGVQPSQQVQILQSEYPGRIQPEHMEEVKHDHFYEGLNLEYQWMLAHKVDGEYSANYSDLLLDIQSWKEEQKPNTHYHPRWLPLVDQARHVLRPQGTYSPQVSWRITGLSLLKLWPLEMVRLKQTLEWSGFRGTTIPDFIGII